MNTNWRVLLTETVALAYFTSAGDFALSETTSSLLRCNSATLQSGHVSVDYVTNAAVPSPEDLPGMVEVLGDGTALVSFLGPALGSMDSKSIQFNPTCDANEVKVLLTIVRAEEFAGSANKNVLWRPRLNLWIRPYQRNARITVVWHMQTTAGRSLRSASTPPFSSVRYPRPQSVLLQ